MTSYDIIWLYPSYFNLGLVDNKPEVVDRFRTWQFEGLLKRLHHERVHLRFGWLKDSGMKVTGVFGWFWMISDDFASVALILPMAQASHMTPNSCAKNCFDLKVSWEMSAEGSCDVHSWKLKMRVSKRNLLFQGSISWGSMLIFRGVLYNMTLMVCTMNLQSTQYSNKMFDQVHTAILVAVAVIIHRNDSEKGIGRPHRVEWGIAPVFNWRFCKMLKTILCDNKLNWTWWITQCCFNKLQKWQLAFFSIRTANRQSPLGCETSKGILSLAKHLTISVTTMSEEASKAKVMGCEQRVNARVTQSWFF